MTPLNAHTGSLMVRIMLHPYYDAEHAKVEAVGLTQVLPRFVDNRLYRENPPPKKVTKKTKQLAAPPQPKPKPVARQGTRRSGRHNVEASPEPEPEPEHETPPVTPGVEWEPVCITRQDWEEFANVFRRSKHPDEKALHTLINNDVLPKVLDEFMVWKKNTELHLQSSFSPQPTNDSYYL